MDVEWVHERDEGVAMARQIVVEHVDDIDGTPIVEGKGETIGFSVNGIDYEIDLSAKNAK
jgi:hypothetical protein